MIYAQALRYLNSLINYEKADSYNYKGLLKLDRMRKLSSILGNPEESFQSIHIAGSKGKGSTAAIIHSILKNAGFKTGLYTSPHLVSFRERIKINDTLISEKDIAILIEAIKDVTDTLKGDDKPSFFEVYTALSFLYFKRKGVDFAILETGLGGRLDATNIVTPLVSVITPISYEHMDKLGPTLSKIAREKGGIIKKDSICVSAPQEDEALKVIENICRKKKTRLIVVGRDIKYKEIDCSIKKERFNVKGLFGNYKDLEIGLLGSHQAMNASSAIGAIEALRYRDIKISFKNIRNGIRLAKWPGRLDIVKRRPYIILDGAQNRASARALADSVKKLFEYSKLILVLGVSKDKDISGIVEELLPMANTAILTKSRVRARAMEPKSIKRFIESRTAPVVITGGVKEALSKSRSMASPRDLILVTGSLFIVGEAMEIIGV